MSFFTFGRDLYSTRCIPLSGANNILEDGTRLCHSLFSLLPAAEHGKLASLDRKTAFIQKSSLNWTKTKTKTNFAPCLCHEVYVESFVFWQWYNIGLPCFRTAFKYLPVFVYYLYSGIAQQVSLYVFGPVYMATALGWNAKILLRCEPPIYTETAF